MSKMFLDILNLSISASWLIAAVLVVRFFIKNHTPKWTLCLLWALVGLRLVLPFSFESELSLVPSRETVNPEAVYTENFTPNTGNEEPLPVDTDTVSVSEGTPVTVRPEKVIHSGIDAIDERVNPIINQSADDEADGSVNRLELIADILSYVWIVGIAAMAVYAVINYLLLKKRVSVFVPDEGGVRRSEAVGSPFILGMFKPRIYLPFGLSEETETHIIAHERAHLKRRDHWIKPIGYGILAVYWFNPLVWAAYVLLCRDIEMACDERVVKNMTAEARKAYASALLECGIKRSVIAACPVAFGETGVRQRVKNALNYKKPMLWIIIAAIIICTAVAVLFLTSPKEEARDAQSESISEDSAHESADASENSDTSEITSDDGFIDYKSYVFDGRIDYNSESDGILYGENFRTFVIENRSELQRILAQCDHTPNLDSETDGSFADFAEGLSDSFFDEKAMIGMYFYAPAITTEYEVIGVIKEAGKLSVSIFVDDSRAYDTAEQHNIVIAVVDKQDIADCEDFAFKAVADRWQTDRGEDTGENSVDASIDVSENSDTSDVVDDVTDYASKPEPDPEPDPEPEPVYDPTPRDIDFEGYIFEEHIDDYVKGMLPKVIDSPEALKGFIYDAFQNKSNSFTAYTESLYDGFFQSNSLIIIYADAPTLGYEYKIAGLRADENGITVTLAYQPPYGAAADAIQENIFALEVRKEEIAGCANFQTESFEAVLYIPEFNATPRQLYFDANIIEGYFEGTEHARLGIGAEPMVIDSYNSFEEIFVTNDPSSSELDELIGYVNETDFKQKMWIVVPAYAPSGGVSFELSDVRVENNGIMVEIQYELPEDAATDEINYVLIIAAVEKAEAVGCTEFRVDSQEKN